MYASSCTHAPSQMVSKALDVASLSTLSKRMFLADSVQAYKPSRSIYDGLLKYVNEGAEQHITGENVWLVSG